MNELSRHLNIDTWERLACGELPWGEEKAAREHIAVCDDCRVTWDALREVRSAAEAFDPAFRDSDAAAPVDRQPSVPSAAPVWRTPLAVAAGLAAVLAVGIWQGGSSPVPESRGSELVAPADRERAGVTLRPVPKLPAERTVGDVVSFSWAGSPTAGRHVVELLDGEGSLLWRSEAVDGSRAVWPDSVLKVAGVYYWRVIAVGEGPEVSSELVRFELRF